MQSKKGISRSLDEIISLEQYTINVMVQYILFKKIIERLQGG